jgi:hypothetical protein
VLFYAVQCVLNVQARRVESVVRADRRLSSGRQDELPDHDANLGDVVADAYRQPWSKVQQTPNPNERSSPARAFRLSSGGPCF